MANTNKSWFSGTQRMDTPLTKKRLIAEIHRVANEKWPVQEKMREARSLVDQYFKISANQDVLNANL